MNDGIVLVTGAAGFIGYHLCDQLITNGFKVIGIDNINDYYDVNLKYARLANLGINKEDIKYNEIIESETKGSQFQFVKLNLEDKENLPKLFKAFKFDKVCNLAAQAGVRYSLENPMTYVDSNVIGFVNLLECMRDSKTPKLVYASSSSVYGMNKTLPFSTEDNVDCPISLYAATKKSNELFAYTYSSLFDIEMIGLRFFTVYGPWGRPDMAMFLFTDSILNDRPIKVFNNGNLSRDFTYIDDIIKGITATIENNNKKKYSLYNIGLGKPVKLMDFIEAIESETGKEAEKIMLPMQPGDVEKTWADTKGLEEDFDYRPSITIKTGISKYVQWYRTYYKDR